MQYAIFEGNIERLEKKIRAIQNKCRKYGCDFTYRRVGREYREIKDENGAVHIGLFIIVEAEGTAVVGGWKLAAMLEHTEKGNIIHRICDVEIPERYYHCDAVCEHCNVNRNRKNTYIVMNEKTGEFKQVGKSCLRDFTHGMSAEAAASYVSMFDEIIQGEAVHSGGFEEYLNVSLFLRYAAEVVRRFGYVKRNNETHSESTVARTMRYYLGGSVSTRREVEKLGIDPDNAESVKLVQDAVQWALSLEDDTNYNHSLKTACSLEYASCKTAGILASLFPAYDRGMKHEKRVSEWKRERDAEAESSDYVGNIGERINVKIRSVNCLTSWETRYGMTRLYKIIGEDGNTYIWKTSGWVDGNAKLLRGTVKDHREYNGVKQTELTRCESAL